MIKSKLFNSVRLFSICATAVALQACGGGSGGSSVPPPPPPPPPPTDTVAPEVSFSPDSLTVESGATGSSALSATDNVGVTSGPTVNCTNGGTFSGSTFTAPTITMATTSVCTAIASDAAGNSGSGTLTVTIPQPQNAPVASAISSLTLVSEGQLFSLDASGSTDADGDSLTYIWRQISGTNIALADNTTAMQSLTAPLLAADETIVFEVTVSDGANRSSAEVSIIVDDIQAISADAKVSPFFPGGQPLALTAITPDSSDGYIIHWTSQGNSSAKPISSQSFTFEDVENGNQVDGEFTNGPSVAGRIVQIVQSGNDVTYVNVTGSYNLHRGRAVGSISFGDAFYSDVNRAQFASQHVAPIGDTQLVFAANTTSSADEYAINAVVVQSDATSVVTEISSASAKNKSSLYVAPYNDNEYAVLWWETNADSSGTDIYMQRATTGGVLLGNKTLISSGRSNLSPRGVALSNGNLLITWDNISPLFVSKGKIFNSSGVLLVDEFEINRPASTGGKGTTLVPLETGGFVVITNPNTSALKRNIVADTFDAEGKRLGNEMLLAEGLDADTTSLSVSSVVSGDLKVVVGWQTIIPNGGIISNQSVGFYPVGKE